MLTEEIIRQYWIDGINNYVIKKLLKMKKSLWQIFSTYTIPTTSDYLQVNFNSDDEFKEVNYKDSDIYKMYKMYLDNSDRMQDRLFNS